MPAFLIDGCYDINTYFVIVGGEKIPTWQLFFAVGIWGILIPLILSTYLIVGVPDDDQDKVWEGILMFLGWAVFFGFVPLFFLFTCKLI